MSRSLRRLFVTATTLTLVGCQPEPDEVLVELSPDVISSLDGRTEVTALVAGERTPLAQESVTVTVSYTDRSGTAHDISPIDGTTDDRGAFHAVVEGLAWDGTGTVEVEVPGTSALGVATFSVIDRTPPTVAIVPPTADLRVGPGLPMQVDVQVTDEIGVSEVVLEAVGEVERRRSTVVVSGSPDATATFRFNIPTDAAAGPTITLHAIAADLSGNYAAADEPVVLTVDPTITIATPPGLAGELLAEGSPQLLTDPRAIAVSPQDGNLYVAEANGNAPCNGGCILKIDAATGTIDPTPVHVGVGEIEGVAFDGITLYFTDRQDRLGSLTWNGSAYAAPASCNDAGAQSPQDPYHLIFDAALGILTPDGEPDHVSQIATCSASSTGNGLTNDGVFDEPRGIAADPAGELYVSDLGDGRVYHVDPANGTVTDFQNDLDEPYGIEWMAGTSAWGNSLMIAISGDNTVASSTGNGTTPVAFLRNPPVDLAIASTTMYVLARPAAGAPGRIYVVTGF